MRRLASKPVLVNKSSRQLAILVGLPDYKCGYTAVYDTFKSNSLSSIFV
jgi:hypothetical protein